MDWCPRKTPAKWPAPFSQMKGWIGKQACALPGCCCTLRARPPTKSGMWPRPAAWGRAAGAPWLGPSPLTASSSWLWYRPCSPQRASRSWQTLVLPRRGAVVGVGLEWRRGAWLQTQEWKFSGEKRAPLLYPKASTDGLGSHTQAVPLGLAAFLWLGRKIGLAQHPHRGASLGMSPSDVLWPGLTAHSYCFLRFLPWDNGNFYKRHFQYQTKGKAGCIILRGVEPFSFLGSTVGLQHSLSFSVLQEGGKYSQEKNASVAELCQPFAMSQ